MATPTASNIPKCSLCFESVKIPEILPCGHTFCMGCIEQCIGDNTNTFPCPICRQDIKIPVGGAKNFTTNFIVHEFQHRTPVRNQPTTTTQPKCSLHNQKDLEYYCNNCNVGLCYKCILGQHKEHEKLDLDSDGTRNKALEKLQRSQNFIQNRIKTLEKTRCTLLESFEELKSLCEDSCAKVTVKTEQIVSSVRRHCGQIIEDIRKDLDENRIKVEAREKEITSEINILSESGSNISPSAKTLNILLTLPRLIEIERLNESRQDGDLSMGYLQWVPGDGVKRLRKMLGSGVPEPFYLPSSHQFLFDVSEVDKGLRISDSKNKCRYNNLVWSCAAGRSGNDLVIDTKLLSDDNPKLNYCIIDGTISVLNFKDDSKTITKLYNDITVKRDSTWILSYRKWWKPVSWTELTDTNNGFVTSSGQFVVQYDIKQVKEISMK